MNIPNEAINLVMSKRNIAYVKPQEPAFLARLKNQIGYKEGPTVETKKQKLDNFSDSDDDSLDREGETPTVVVLKEGDLSAEEAAREEARIAKEAAEAPADLNQRIIFKVPKEKDSNSKEILNKTSSRAPAAPSSSSSSASTKQSLVKAEEGSVATEKTKNSWKKKNKKNNKNKNSSSKLSFTNEDEGEEYEEEEH